VSSPSTKRADGPLPVTKQRREIGTAAVREETHFNPPVAARMRGSGGGGGAGRCVNGGFCLGFWRRLGWKRRGGGIGGRWGGAENGDKIGRGGEGRGAGDGCSFPAVAVGFLPFLHHAFSLLVSFQDYCAILRKTTLNLFFVNFALQYDLQVNYSSYIVNYSQCLRI
jgi:hypothetical protein